MNKFTLPAPPTVIGTHPPIPPLPRGGIGGVSESEKMPNLKPGGDFQSVESEFRETILPCKLQRHMQALGAYGFLSSVKGKKYFLKYVAEGLRLLKEDVLLSKDEYPGLYDLTAKL